MGGMYRVCCGFVVSFIPRIVDRTGMFLGH
jgi:hypothetical protein